MAELTVVIPVYNEEGAIDSVLQQWTEVFANLMIDYQVAAYNDGSTDNTKTCLELCADKNPRIKVINKKNLGHGPTILQGYKDNIESPWILQIDSDGELEPAEFVELWENRVNYDFLSGVRVQRKSPIPRAIMTWVSRCVVWGFYGRVVDDVNCPYRLFRPNLLKKHLDMIPKSTFAPNIIIAGIVSMLGLRVYQVDVIHTERQTGVVSIKKWRLLRAAILSLSQTIIFRVGMSLRVSDKMNSPK